MRRQQLFVSLGVLAGGLLIGGAYLQSRRPAVHEVTAANRDIESAVDDRMEPEFSESASIATRATSGIATPEVAPDETGGDLNQSPMAKLAAAKEKSLSKLLLAETELLVAAGFTLQRAEWLQQRSQQLRAESEQLANDRRSKDPDMANAYVVDPDLDLLLEAGQDDYDRYRQALGRQLGVSVKDVLNGSVAQTAGLKANDVIVSYSGKRLYSMQMLNALIADGRPSANNYLNVIRDGQNIQIAVPNGGLGFVPGDPLAARRAHMERIVKIVQQKSAP